MTRHAETLVEIGADHHLQFVDAILEEHRVWLDEHCSAGRFLLFGRRVPREGGFIILLQPLHAVQELATWPLAPRIALVFLGLLCFGVGSAFYIGANLGAGPRDSLMLVGSRRTGLRIGAMRAMIEISVLLIGFLLGGTVGLGTLAFAALIGPSVEASFWLVTRLHLT